MFMKASLLAAAALTLCLSACSPAGGLSPAAQADVANALAVSCPAVAAAQGRIPGDPDSQAAYSLLVGVCPPNPPPTNAVVAAIDILNAYDALKAAAQ
jgi:hypothetical protein